MTKLEIPGVVRDHRKITHYLLNDDHPDGGPKARFFKQFGFTNEGWAALVAALEEHALRNFVAATQSSGYGVKHIVECNLTTPDGRNPCVRTVWMQDEAGGQAIFVTAYPRDASGRAEFA